MTATTTIGVFDTPERAQAAVADLRNAGFSPDQIGVVYRGQAEAAPDGGGGWRLDPTQRQWEEGRRHRRPPRRA
ncbi:MAG: general stress protein [Gemmataceae bacterium]